MVRGLNIFREYFASYVNCYAIIGGTACTVVMEDAGLNFRATKDLDIVLYVEAIDKEFVNAFREFVKSGGYQNQQKSTGKKIFYRFYSPRNSGYPVMLELFSRQPDGIALGNNSHLTPIPFEEEVTSLSAILLDDDYYSFIRTGKIDMNGLSVVGAEYLIPLKAKAWIDLCQRKDDGEEIDSKSIRKHRNDVVRLYRLLSSDTKVILSDSIKQDMEFFVQLVHDQGGFDVKQLGLKTTTLEVVLDNFKQIYNLSN